MTTTTVSSEGKVVLPSLVRNQLRLAPGTKLFCEIRGDSVILTPEHLRRSVREYTIDSLTGLRVTKASADLLGADRLPGYALGAKQVTDGHLLELAKAASMQLATLDKGIPGACLIS